MATFGLSHILGRDENGDVVILGGLSETTVKYPRLSLLVALTLGLAGGYWYGKRRY